MSIYNLPLINFLEQGNISQTDIHQWISANIEKEDTLYAILSEVQSHPKYFHIALEYAEISIQRWNYVHPKALDAIEYLCNNFTKLAEDNHYIINFLSSYRGTTLLQNKLIIDRITSLDPTKFDASLTFKLLEHFTQNYKNNPLLAEKYTFYQKALEHVATIKPEFAEDIYRLSPEVIFQQFRYSLEDGYELYFNITQTRGRHVFASDKELAFLKRAGEGAIFTSIQKMSLSTFYGFIDRFVDKYSSNGINFLGFQGLENLEAKKRYYLSIIYSTKIFENDEKKTFLSFIIEQIQLRKGKIFQENSFSRIDEILNFLSNIGISIFDEKSILNDFIGVINDNEQLSWSFEKYIKNLSGRQVFENMAHVEGVLDSITISHKRLQENFYNFIIWELLRFHEIETFITLEKKYYLIRKSNNIYEIKKYLISIEHAKLAHKKYRVIGEFMEIICSQLELTDYELTRFFDYFSQGNGRMKYLTIRYIKRIHIEISIYELRKIRERCFFHSSFPINMYHWVRLLIE